MVDKTGYWAVIQFQLSSKACEDKGKPWHHFLFMAEQRLSQ